MHTHFRRRLASHVTKRLSTNPAVAILGPRQCGKTTLAKKICGQRDDALYLDLERSSDRNRLSDPEAFFEINRERLICLDEIQRIPELFTSLRSAIDEGGRNGQFLILGSASRDLLRQSSETLAGRLAFLELTPLVLPELGGSDTATMRRLWLRGGFPRSYLAPDDAESSAWRHDFIRTFLERDIPQLGLRIASQRMERFWSMCAHSHGQLLNSSKLGESLGVSYQTVRSYAELLEKTFLLRLLPPFETNLKKRVVKSPRPYLRDSGLLHALLDIRDQNELLGHPGYGASWEGFAIEHILSAYPDWRAGFFRLSSGAEIDLVMQRGQRRVALECKASSAPTVSRGFWNALTDLDIEEAYVVAPVREGYPLKGRAMVVGLDECLQRLACPSLRKPQ